MGQEIETISEPWRVQEHQLRDWRLDVPICDALTWITVPTAGDLAPKRDTAIARLAGSRIFLALLTYKARTGVYPASLSALCPLLGGRVPNDPFSGKGFVYQKQGVGFFLYSIGPNLKDEGGDGDGPSTWQSLGAPDDIAWYRP